MAQAQQYNEGAARRVLFHENAVLLMSKCDPAAPPTPMLERNAGDVRAMSEPCRPSSGPADSQPGSGNQW
jgi:hypothetical protein